MFSRLKNSSTSGNGGVAECVSPGTGTRCWKLEGALSASRLSPTSHSPSRERVCRCALAPPRPSLALRRSRIVVLVPCDVSLLPVAEGDLQHPDRCGAAAHEAMLAVHWNPYFIAGFMHGEAILELNDGAVIQYYPELAPAGVRLKTQAL